ncbi:MAG: glutathione S-transferase family protein [Hyphomicrobiales bacterium]|nr:glutathione S-transferase family protein [Hyphomicrobiales bacterium]
MKLYTLPGSPNSRKVVAVLNHLGLKAEITGLDFASGDTTRPEFVALNPNAMVPVLVDGDVTLWESNAINIYLVEKAGGSSLFPADPVVRADVLRWQFWELAHFNRAFGTVVFESVIKPKFGFAPPSKDLMDFCLQEIARYAPVLDGRLEGRATLVGSGVTLADYAMICLEKYRDAIDFDWSRFANINRYFDAMRATDAWSRADSTLTALRKAA